MRKANKIVMMTVAMLLSAVLLTTSALSGTLAKYVTSGGSYSDSARVAKWGVKIYIDPNEDVLNSVYEDFDASKDMKVTVDESGTQATVVITDLMIGPGDDLRDMLRIRFDGTAEVKLQVKVSQGILYSGDYTEDPGPQADYKIFRFKDLPNTANDEYYVPMAFTFGGLDYSNDSSKTYTSIIGKNTKIGELSNEYALAPWRYFKGSPSGAGSLVGMNNAETAYMEHVTKFVQGLEYVTAKGTEGDTRDAYIKKTFNPNDPIVFKTENGDIDTLAFGLEWPFTYSDNSHDEAFYDDLATEFGRRVYEDSKLETKDYYITLVYNISITQLNK